MKKGNYISTKVKEFYGNESLFDPDLFHDPLDLSHVKKEDVISFYKTMMSIRLAEEKLADEIINKNIKCPVHLSIGQEAIATGVHLL